jgi:hypothetical protein
MQCSTRLLEAQLDVTLICSAVVMNDKNLESPEFNALPIDAHLPLPTISVCILDPSYGRPAHGWGSQLCDRAHEPH